MFRMLNVEVRGGHPMFGELGVDEQFVGLEKTVRDWVWATRYKRSHGVGLNERRVGLQAVVTQTLNNYICDNGIYGQYTRPERSALSMY